MYPVSGATRIPDLQFMESLSIHGPFSRYLLSAIRWPCPAQNSFVGLPSFPYLRSFGHRTSALPIKKPPPLRQRLCRSGSLSSAPQVHSNHSPEIDAKLTYVDRKQAGRVLPHGLGTRSSHISRLPAYESTRRASPFITQKSLIRVIPDGTLEVNLTVAFSHLGIPVVSSS